MNESFYKKAKESIQSISMTSSEKKVMVKRIMETSVIKAPVRSTWNVFSFTSFVGSHRVASAFAAFVLIFLGGNSLVGAAHSALPGDALYSLKVNVAEPMRLALTSDFATEAQVQSEIMQTRFEEAELLAVHGDLDEKKEQELAVRVSQNLNALHTKIKKIKESSEEKAMEVTDAAQAGIRAHARLLSSISLERGEEKPKLSDTTREAFLALNDDQQDSFTSRVANQFDVQTKKTQPESAPTATSLAITVPAPTAGATRMAKDALTTLDLPISATSVVNVVVTDDSINTRKAKVETSTAIMQSSLMVEVSSTTDREFRKQLKEEEIFQKAKEKLEKRSKRIEGVLKNKGEVIQADIPVKVEVKTGL